MIIADGGHLVHMLLHGNFTVQMEAEIAEHKVIARAPAYASCHDNRSGGVSDVVAPTPCTQSASQLRTPRAHWLRIVMKSLMIV